MDIDVLNALDAKSDLFTCTKKWFWLFAKTGFTDRMVKETDKHGNVRLIRFDDMI